MCKQALWLAPAPPASTPNHHNHNAINNQAEIKFTSWLQTIIQAYILDKVKDSLGRYSFKELI